MNIAFAESPVVVFGLARGIAKNASRSTHFVGVLSALVFVLLLGELSSTALAAVNPVPLPLDVPGKAISDWTNTGDQQSDGTANPHMTRNWKGDGTTMDSLDYTLSLTGLLGSAVAPDVDALANAGDLFFDALVNDKATLLVSPRELQNAAGGGLNEIYYQTATPYGSLTGVWAKNAPDIGGAAPSGVNIPPEGIDGLEVWGSDTDHNMFSLYTDPSDLSGRQISIVQYDIGTDTSAPYIYNDEVRMAIGLMPQDPAIDLDALMVLDKLGDGMFDTGDSVIFSVEENPQFHGGEIWVWNSGSPATYLNHGGITWDTANQPGLIFGWTDSSGLVTNDVNAMEAILEVPEPGCFVMLILGLVGVFGYSRQRSRH